MPVSPSRYSDARPRHARHRSARGFLIVALACLLITGCASGLTGYSDDPTSWTVAAGDEVRLAPSFTIENLPYFPQEDDQCGPASLATMLGARGIEVSTQALRNKVYIPAKEGALTTEMVARARRYGLLVYPLAPKVVDVTREIGAGNPVLVLQNLGLDWFPLWHFSVVIGYDLNRQTLTLRSGKQRAYEVDLALFQKTWQRGGSWAVVMLPPDTLPATAQIANLIQSANELEQVGQLAPALDTYEAMISRWPESPMAYFGAGNAAYALGQYKLASDQFKHHLQRSPSSSAGWNNLAYSLTALQCPHAATVAISCALKYSPDNTEVQASFAEISSIQRTNNASETCTTLSASMMQGHALVQTEQTGKAACL
ncbi:MAG: hypothetical protein COB04_11620 [Gammaproteobacteria bacterium]|nr:MAG: hypothetical protein COB04_11620 [Gammaproteobacteria bacterium]